MSWPFQPPKISASAGQPVCTEGGTLLPKAATPKPKTCKPWAASRAKAGLQPACSWVRGSVGGEVGGGSLERQAEPEMRAFTIDERGGITEEQYEVT